MRRFLLLSLLITFLFSCQENEKPSVAEFPQKWVLTGYNSGWMPELGIIPVVDSLYYYELRKDGTFTKFIGEYELDGTYEKGKDEIYNTDNIIFQYDQETYLKDRESEGLWLIHNCGMDSEYFTFMDPNTIRGSWGACDGPNFYFERE